MKTYIISRARGDVSAPVLTMVSPEGGAPYPLGQVVYHSPTGVEYGYPGSGPADLALTLLCDALAERPSPEDLTQGRSRGWMHHQTFKSERVATVPRETSEWRITDVEILTWVAAHEQPCEHCGGSGTERDIAGEYACFTCNGLGVTRAIPAH